MLNPPEIKTKRYERKLALREGDVKKKGRGERLPLRCGVLRCNFVRKVEQVDRPIHVGNNTSDTPLFPAPTARPEINRPATEPGSA